MIRFTFISPKMETLSSKTYSFFTGLNVYTGLGCYGIGVGILGFGFFLEYLKK